MSRAVSFVILVACVLLMAAVFIHVMAQFLLPMFLAVLLVVMFRPLHAWFLRKCGGRIRLAAGLTTVSIVLIVLIPLLCVFGRGAAEGYSLASRIDQETLREAIINKAGHALDELRLLGAKVGIEVPGNRELVQTAAANVESWVAPAALRTTQFLGSAVVGLAIMLVSLYFFLADGPDMVRSLMKLTPLDTRYEQQLLDEFVRVSRAVVLATLLTAVGQGLLAGVGYFFAGLSNVFLLTAMTMLLSLVPIVGTASVWGSCSLWLYFYEERTTAAVLLAIWGLVAVSFADNLIKPYLLHGQSNLHPLLALLSVLGGVETLGPIGIFVGPMVVSFLQALLNILRTELDAMDDRRLVESASKTA